MCYARSQENLARLARALAELHPHLRGAPRDLPFRLDAKTVEMGSNFTFDTDVGPLDLLGWVEPLGDYTALARSAVDLPFGDRTVRTLSVDALIVIKRHVNRPKDQASLAELLAIKRERGRGGGA